MRKKDGGPRLVVNAGGVQFLLPPGVDMNALACLCQARPLESCYVSGKGNRASRSYLVEVTRRKDTYSSSRVEVKVVNPEDLGPRVNDLRDGAHSEYDLIIPLVKEALDGKECRAVFFQDRVVNVEDEEFAYRELADPSNTPEVVVGELVEAALRD